MDAAQASAGETHGELQEALDEPSMGARQRCSSMHEVAIAQGEGAQACQTPLRIEK